MIRDWMGEDARSIARYANNRKIAMWLRDRFPSPYTEADARTFLAAVFRQNPRTVFAIATQGEAIGGIGLEFRDDVHRFTAELGYWLGEPFWGRGIMTEAIRQFTSWAFEHLEVHRIYAAVFDGNDAVGPRPGEGGLRAGRPAPRQRVQERQYPRPVALCEDQGGNRVTCDIVGEIDACDGL